MLSTGEGRDVVPWRTLVAAIGTWSLAVTFGFLLVGLVSDSWSVALLVAGAGFLIVAIVVLSNAFVAWRFGRAVGNRYGELLMVRGSSEETRVLVGAITQSLCTGRRRWKVDRSAGRRRGSVRVAVLRVPASLSSLGEKVTIESDEG